MGDTPPRTPQKSTTVCHKKASCCKCEPAKEKGFAEGGPEGVLNIKRSFRVRPLRGDKLYQQRNNMFYSIVKTVRFSPVFGAPAVAFFFRRFLHTYRWYNYAAEL